MFNAFVPLLSLSLSLSLAHLLSSSLPKTFEGDLIAKTVRSRMAHQETGGHPERQGLLAEDQVCVAHFHRRRLTVDLPWKRALKAKGNAKGAE